MVRWLAILALTLTALRGAGIAAPGSDIASHPAPESCHVTVVKTTCCGMRTEVTICPRSGGACRCAARPGDDDGRPTPIPAPNHERNPMQAVRQATALVHHTAGGSFPVAMRGSIALARSATFTHNGYQALLGVWRR